MLEIFILSIIQGITEFLPISSSSHLILVSSYLSFSNQSLPIDISLHIGSFFAVIFYFRNDIYNFFKNKKLFLKIILSSIPVMLIGFLLFKFNLIDQLRNIKTIGWMTILFGVLLYVSDQFASTKKIKDNLDYKSILFIGLFQVLSLIPGVSRSGITISAARMLKFDRTESTKISFLLSIPTLAAVCIFGIYNLINSNSLHFSMSNLLSILFSFVFSLITIKYFLKYIKNFNLNIFVIYRIILGTVILVFAYS
jgi:undecaprenyl-diphosphatase